MKIKYEVTKHNSNIIYKVTFKIESIISKEQFKTLMCYSDYNSKTRTGAAVFDSNAAEKATKFTAYIDLINKDESQYKIEYKKQKAKSEKISFRDYCEEFLDQDVDLISDEDREVAYKAYNN